MFLLCFRMLQDRDEADSATQDTFLKAYPGGGESPATGSTNQPAG